MLMFACGCLRNMKADITVLRDITLNITLAFGKRRLLHGRGVDAERRQLENRRVKLRETVQERHAANLLESGSEPSGAVQAASLLHQGPLIGRVGDFLWSPGECCIPQAREEGCP